MLTWDLKLLSGPYSSVLLTIKFTLVIGSTSVGTKKLMSSHCKNALSFNEIGGSSCLVRGLLTSLNCITLVSGDRSNSSRFLSF